MKIAIIGRTAMLYNTALLLLERGHEIPLVVTCKEAPEYSVKSDDFKALAQRIGARFIHTAKINLEENVEFIKSAGNIDIAISVNYSGVIASEVIDLFRLGILNGHAGDLPRYRGNAPLAWAILNGESRVGLCVQKMIGGELDSGDIVVREYHPVDIDTKVGELDRWIVDRIPSMMVIAVDRLSDNPNYALEVQSKDPADALRCYPRIPDDGKIDWREDNLEILRLINASSEPYSGAFCEYDGLRMTIWNASLWDDGEVYSAVPGQISEINRADGFVSVICGSGKLLLKEVSYNGYRGVPGEVVKSIRRRVR